MNYDKYGFPIFDDDFVFTPGYEEPVEKKDEDKPVDKEDKKTDTKLKTLF